MKRLLLLASLTATLMLSVFAGSASAYSSDTGWWCGYNGGSQPYGNGMLICSLYTHTWWYVRP